MIVVQQNFDAVNKYRQFIMLKKTGVFKTTSDYDVECFMDVHNMNVH